MIDRKADGDAAASLMERPWFASIAAVRTMQAECEVLREVMELTEGAWRRARSQLAPARGHARCLGRGVNGEREATVAKGRSSACRSSDHG
jgi:hypothetical protein